MVETVCAAHGYVPQIRNNSADAEEKVKGIDATGNQGKEWDVEEERRRYRERKEIDRWLRRELLVKDIENNLTRVRRRAGLPPIVFIRTVGEGN